MSVAIPGRHTLDFPNRLDIISVRCWTSADGVPAREETLRVEPDWTNMTARFRRYR